MDDDRLDGHSALRSRRETFAEWKGAGDGRGNKSGGSCHSDRAEIYDSATGVWTPTGAMNTAAYRPGLALLPDGKLLMAGGTDSNSTAITNSEIYDVGLGFSNAWQPQITSATSPLAIGGSVTVNGSGFSQMNGNQSGPDGQGFFDGLSAGPVAEY